MDVRVTHDRDRQRFELLVDAELAGFADYRPVDGILAFTHTEVDPARRGQGLGAALIGGALDQVRADGGRIRPLCSFVADYLRRHPADGDLVADPED